MIRSFRFTKFHAHSYLLKTCRSFTKNEKPLKGIRVLDLSRILVGPYCSMYLADFGADVIKIEAPDGDETRKWGPPFKGPDSTYYLSVNRNKKSMTVDLKSPEGLNLIYELAKESDVLLENFSHGVTERLKVDYETLSKINPRLIYASVTSYGSEGPYASKPGFDNIIQSIAGIVHITGNEQEPFKVGVAITDVLTGLNITIGILTALYARNKTGYGQKVETSLLDCSVEALVNVASAYLNGGKEAKRWGNHHPSIVPYGVYKLGDGKFITIACGTDKQYQEMCKAINRPDLAKDPRFIANKYRVEHRNELNQELNIEFERYTLANLLADLEHYRVPCGPINNLEALFNDQHVKETHLVEEVQSPHHGLLKLVKNPVKFGETEVTKTQPPPVLGEHTDEILEKILKKSPQEIKELRSKGIVK